MKPMLLLLRPRQWVKNLFVVAPLLFSLQFTNAEAIMQAAIALGGFILLSGAVYAVNDIVDRKADQKHPRKKHRPVASGKVSVPAAMALTAVVLTAGLGIIALWLPGACLSVALVYVTLQFAYSARLKRLAIFDVLVIALGFVLRVMMGAYAIGVPVSAWIILTTFLLALFLGFGKRAHEISLKKSDQMRASLSRYSPALLDRLISISCVSALLSYALYAVETSRALGKTEFVYTVLFVVFGLFRYLQIIYVDHKGGEPEHIVLKDPVFVLNGFAWLALSVWILRG